MYPYPDVPVERLVDTPRGPDLEVDFAELRELSETTREQWRNDGFDESRSYLDLNGDLVMVAARADDVSKAQRFLIDGVSVEVNIPPSLQGKDVRTNHTVGQRRLYFNKQSIYDVRTVETRDLPSELQMVVQKFGDVLYEDEVQPGKWVLDNGNSEEASAYDLAIVEGEVAQKNDETYEADRRRAYLTEKYAKVAMDLVPMPRIRTSKKLAQAAEKREQAYRDELKRQHSLSDEIYKGL